MILAELTIPSEPDIERQAAEQVLAATRGLPLSQRQRDRLRTAIAETVMNAAEHGNHYRPDRPVAIQVLLRGNDLLVRIADSGGGPIPDPVTPNLDAKLEGAQSTRGWGLFLIEQMVDHVQTETTPAGHTVQLTVRLAAEAESAD